MEFKIRQKSKKSRARTGIIKTSHGILHTPAFFPVATQACLKTLTSEDIKAIGFEGILCNTYHLLLRPGEKLIKRMGGLHRFMNFSGVIATDSGGFQVFSLGKGLEQKIGKIPGQKRNKNGEISKPSLVKMREEGVYFKSHLNGQKHFLSPEKCIRIQQDLDSDIMFVLDECNSPLDNFEQTKKAMGRTHRWAIRCLKAANSPKSKSSTDPHSKNQKSKILEQGLFGIIQGGKFKKLREQSAKLIGSLDFDGFGIGGTFGRSYGDSKRNMQRVLNATIPHLPAEKPRHLLGIGHLEDLQSAVAAGVDLFDCVYPTRMGRHGIAITSAGELNMAKTTFLADKKPLDKKCHCLVCQNYSRSYIAHLFRAGEITALHLLTFHNLWFFKQFVDNIRKKVENNKI